MQKHHEKGACHRPCRLFFIENEGNVEINLLFCLICRNFAPAI